MTSCCRQLCTYSYVHYVSPTSWSYVGACHSLEHLDLSGCEKITDHTLKKLSVGLGDLVSSERRAKLLKTCPVPITVTEEGNLHAVGRRQRAFIFKHGTARWGSACIQTQVWVLDTSDLADIEDAAEWSRGGMPFSESLAETQLVGGSCCCRRRRRKQRTGSNASYLHHQYAISGEMLCGHSTCCSSEKALRTFNGPQSDSGTTRASIAELRTKCPPSGGLQCLEPENRTECSKARQSLKFLSLSGCYQITDLGLR